MRLTKHTTTSITAASPSMRTPIENEPPSPRSIQGVENSMGTPPPGMTSGDEEQREDGEHERDRHPEDRDVLGVLLEQTPEERQAPRRPAPAAPGWP